jgi:hypothetical protein
MKEAPRTVMFNTFAIEGMTLRDHIACKVLPAVMNKWPSASEIGAAELAYMHADAMLLVRDMNPDDYGMEMDK